MNLSSVSSCQSDCFLVCPKRLKDRMMLRDVIDSRITAAALRCGLFFRAPRPLAVISGAGIVGLAASFELRARGFNVAIVERRKEFSRFNVITLAVEAQFFLKRFNLLEKFENYVAARIEEHRLMLIDKNKSAKLLQRSNVSGLQLGESVSFEPTNFNKIFKQNGIYSARIGLLQTFLAENALEAGVNIFGDTTVRILSRTSEGGVSKVKIGADQTLETDLFFIAEGAHSTSACELSMGTKEVINACTGENWIFGNMPYFGQKGFVVSLIDASEKTLRIANLIFDPKSRVINVAVTAEKEVQEDSIREQICRVAHQVLDLRAFSLDETEDFSLEKAYSGAVITVPKPVHITNRTSVLFSRGNVFCIGDSAVSSSPLAGLGGTLGLTLIPRTIRQLLDDSEKQPSEVHKNFKMFSEAYTSRWIEKSQQVKQFCIKAFEQERGCA